MPDRGPGYRQQGPRRHLPFLRPLEQGGTTRSVLFYMAGPPGLIDALFRPVMRSGKVASGHIFFDRFY